MKVSKLLTIDEFVCKRLKEKHVNASGLVESLLDDWLRKTSKTDESRLNEEKKIIEEKIAREEENRIKREQQIKKETEELLTQLNLCDTWKEFIYTEQTTDEEIMELNKKLRELKFKVDFLALKRIFENV